MSRHALERRGGEAGFTMPELLVALSITGIISATIAAAIVVSLRATDEADRRLGESIDAQLAAATFTGDVHAAQEVATSSLGCGSGALASLRWEDGGQQVVATWAVTSTSPRVVVRRLCRGGVVTVEQTIARRISGSGAAGTLECSPTPCSGSPSSPRSVLLRINQASGATFDLRAVRRTA